MAIPVASSIPQPGPVLTGNRVLVYFAGQAIGLCTSVEVTDDYGLEPAMNIGTIYVPEYVPTVADFTISVSSMLLTGGDLFGGAGSGPGVLAGKVFDFAISIGSNDKGGSTGPPSNLVMYSGCTFSRGTLRVDAHRIVVYQATFKATTRGANGPNANITQGTGSESKGGPSTLSNASKLTG